MTPSQTRPPVGASGEGGIVAGFIRSGEDVFCIVVAPKAEGETTSTWHKASDIAGACSYFDGHANTIAMAEAGSSLAKWAQALAIAGHTDWYLPARDELELLYRNLKPNTEENYRYRSGDNPSSLPAGYPYTKTAPAQTSALAFQQGGSEAFEQRWYWSSTQYSRNIAWYQDFDDGGQLCIVKHYEGRARAVRRFKVE